MKLNPDIIRNVLLTIEEKCDFYTNWEYQKDTYESIYLAELTHEEIVYHIRQCEKFNLIEEVHYYDGGTTIIICDLTPAGHEFLANTRNISVWKATLQKGVGASLPILLEIAKDIALKHFLG